VSGPPASRKSAQRLWDDFLPRAGAAYAAERNNDPGPEAVSPVSRLSPYLRHRAVTEAELARATVALHGEAGEKFIDELCWRTYWKGWLQAHPAAWSRYCADVAALSETRHGDVAAARDGATGIDAFDAWAAELKAYNYLHNHARMWFASIWIHTLRLPWQLGAQFFMDHLLDGDPASNTLSWRWVAGLHTRGKAYLARADNIARYTQGRFHPAGLAETPLVLSDAPFAREGIGMPMPPPAGAALWLLHDDDLDGDGQLVPAGQPVMIGASDVSTCATIEVFRSGLRADAAARCGAALPARLTATSVIAVARAAGVERVLTPQAPVGPTAALLCAIEPALSAAGISLHRVRRVWDATAWPHASKGFFAFRQVIPRLLAI
jgi:deoxyribodipyrimidine photo-lyase